MLTSALTPFWKKNMVIKHQPEDIKENGNLKQQVREQDVPKGGDILK